MSAENPIRQSLETMIASLKSHSAQVGPIPLSRWRMIANPRLFPTIAAAVPAHFTGLQWVLSVGEDKINLMLDRRAPDGDIYLVNPYYNRTFTPGYFANWRASVAVWVESEIRRSIKR